MGVRKYCNMMRIYAKIIMKLSANVVAKFSRLRFGQRSFFEVQMAAQNGKNFTAT